MIKPLKEQAVVITGASSGIGRLTALELGRHGAAVVLAARTEDALREAAADVEREGGQALAIVTDVGDWKQVERLAESAVNRFGRIDTWINNAGVTEYARLDETTPEEAEQILRVNLLGQILGTKVALAVMRRQNAGHILNVASVEAVFGVPFQSVYVASKHGVKGFTESVRRELALEKVPIYISMLLPPGTNTPLFDHARSKLESRPMPLPPVYEPEVVVEALVAACTAPQHEIVVGAASKAFTVMERISPALVDWVLQQRSVGEKQQKSDQPNDHRDNLFGPVPGPHEVHGNFSDKAFTTSPYTRWIEMRPATKGLLIGAACIGLALFLFRK